MVERVFQHPARIYASEPGHWNTRHTSYTGLQTSVYAVREAAFSSVHPGPGNRTSVRARNFVISPYCDHHVTSLSHVGRGMSVYQPPSSYGDETRMLQAIRVLNLATTAPLRPNMPKLIVPPPASSRA